MLGLGIVRIIDLIRVLAVLTIETPMTVNLTCSYSSIFVVIFGIFLWLSFAIRVMLYLIRVLPVSDLIALIVEFVIITNCIISTVQM